MCMYIYIYTYKREREFDDGEGDHVEVNFKPRSGIGVDIRQGALKGMKGQK